MNYSQWFRHQLSASMDGFVWGAEQVPSARRYRPPPRYLGDRTAARHVFHMIYYEQTVALPSMHQWLGGGRPDLKALDEDAAWNDEEKHKDFGRLLAEFRTVRGEQLALLPKFDGSTWAATREAVWGPVTLL